MFGIAPRPRPRRVALDDGAAVWEKPIQNAWTAALRAPPSRKKNRYQKAMGPREQETWGCREGENEGILTRRLGKGSSVRKKAMGEGHPVHVHAFNGDSRGRDQGPSGVARVGLASWPTVFFLRSCCEIGDDGVEAHPDLMQARRALSHGSHSHGFDGRPQRG